jgi:hypothetical protein
MHAAGVEPDKKRLGFEFCASDKLGVATRLLAHILDRRFTGIAHLAAMILQAGEHAALPNLDILAMGFDVVTTRFANIRHGLRDLLQDHGRLIERIGTLIRQLVFMRIDTGKKTLLAGGHLTAIRFEVVLTGFGDSLLQALRILLCPCYSPEATQDQAGDDKPLHTRPFSDGFVMGFSYASRSGHRCGSKGRLGRDMVKIRSPFLCLPQVLSSGLSILLSPLGRVKALYA